MTQRHPFHAALPEQATALRWRALKLTADRHRAEDLTQETLMKAWASRDSFQPGTHLRSWLFTIMRNTHFSHVRKHRREVEDVDEVRAQALAVEGSQLHAMALKELLSAVVDLPADQRRAVVLMGGYGYSQLEAAEICGCAEGTIKSRVSRGRAALGHLGPDHAAPGLARKAPARPGPRLSPPRDAALHRVLMPAGSAEN